MIAPKDVEQNLMNFFAAVQPQRGRLFTVREFDLNVMMNAFSAEDRAALQPALASLLEAQIIYRASPTEYGLTAEGLRRAREIQAARRVAASAT